MRSELQHSKQEILSQIFGSPNLHEYILSPLDLGTIKGSLIGITSTSRRAIIAEAIYVTIDELLSVKFKAFSWLKYVPMTYFELRKLLCYSWEIARANKSTFIIVMVGMEHPEKRKSSKEDSLDLEARARVTFAATADETDESGVGSKYDEESLSNEDLHEYLDEVINEVSKKKSYSSQIRKDET
jgi:hypothetical protein